MKKLLVFLLLLAGGVAASAWLGVMDSKPDADESDPASLNTYIVRRIYGTLPAAAPSTVYTTPAYSYSTANTALYNQAYQQRKIYQSTRSLVPIARYLGTPSSGDWRGKIREPEQNYNQFILEKRQARGTLLIQPIGNLPIDQKKAIGHVIDSMRSFFGMPVFCNTPITLDKIPAQCYKVRNGKRQINAEALMDYILRPKLESGVAAVIAITTLDLFPGDRWPFESALGWSSFDNGTSVLSTQRILENARADRGQNLLRMSKLSIHELAHTFGLKHCSKFNCMMNGCSDIQESDGKPLALCPDCLAKLSLATGHTPKEHLESMLEVSQEKGFVTETKYYLKALQLLR